ncbi:MAG: glycosyltransferase family 4 protein, partial [Pseudomonadota bacterium]
RIAEQLPALSHEALDWLKAQEVNLANTCERVITVSERDRDLLIAAGVRDDHVRTIPHGVDLQTFSNAPAIDVHSRYGIPAGHRILVFHGIYSYPPNLQAVKELSLSLLARLEHAGLPATVLAIGPEPSAMPLADVVFTGPVDDLAGHLKAGDLAVIPLRDGGGTRMKILDDFAAGVAVVTTSKGMEGIPVEHGEQLWIEDDPQAMAEAVIALLNDDERRRRLSDNALRWVSRFDWREIAQRYLEFVRRPL